MKGLQQNSDMANMNVTVMLSSYNGEKYIGEQIESILSQKGVNVTLYVRDDGSVDSTQLILDKYQEEGKLKWYTGDNIKPARSFINLAKTIPLDTEYYAFSDQDDIWLPDKLYTGCKRMEECSDRGFRPILYYSDTKLVDENLNTIDDNRIKIPAITFKQSIMINGAAGCTMCFNLNLVNYLRMAEDNFGIMHDNLIFKICTFLGGIIIYDENPHILYRQHSNNAIGGKNKSSFRRHLREMINDKNYRSNAVKLITELYREYIPTENLVELDKIIGYRRLKNRVSITLDKGYRTGNKKNDIYFKAGILLGQF